MGAAEISHRVLRRLAMAAEQHGWFGLWIAGPVPAPDLTQRGVHWLVPPRGLAPAPYIAAAERILAGKFDVFALRGINLGSPPRWNRDCKTGIEAPLVFGKRLDYRNPALVGDIKYLWEPNRHLHLVTLAQAYALTGRPAYGQAIRQHVESWLAECPPGLGPNWSSALEAGLRLISWSLAWQLIGSLASPLFQGEGGREFRRRWLESVYRHQRFIAGFFSRHSSANNHLMGEAAGLFVAALTWPHWPASRRWQRRSRAILEREILRQNAPDGVNREQAVAYQHFELDLLLMVLRTAAAAGEPVSKAYRERLEAMLDYLAAIMDGGGNLPMFGDSDDGVVAALAQEEGFSPYRSLLASGALLFHRGDFKAKAGSLDDKTRWLFSREGRIGVDAAYAALPVSHGGGPARCAFPEGGYYILGCAFDSAEEIRLVADAGPLGYLAIAAHGHADALSFTLAVGGREFLIDPGTYAYHTQGAWRDYFRGTAAHNTLRVDGLDQSVSGGNFMWLRHARGRCLEFRQTPHQDYFAGWHDGYLRLADPVAHTRRISLDKFTHRIVIEDVLDMAGEHEVELFFHTAEACSVTVEPGGYALSRDGQTIHLSLPEAPAGSQAEIACLRGSHSPIAGWVSRRFDLKQTTATLRWKARLQGPALLRTEIRI
ncbi:MAG: alginate lyase family protein [Betaproteobacteria bacterium]|nr:alginate lyase family protein [Betaproteobacteria bacterium]